VAPVVDTSRGDEMMAPSTAMGTVDALTADELARLSLLADTLFPELGGDGLSATMAGAVDYITSLLADDPTMTLLYRRGLAAAWHGLPAWPAAVGAAAAAARLSELFEEARAADLPLGLSGSPTASALSEAGDLAFVLVLWQHVREGLYSDPRHGGNRDASVWQWLGYSGPQMRGYTDSEVLENRLISRPLKTANDWHSDAARQ